MYCICVVGLQLDGVWKRSQPSDVESARPCLSSSPVTDKVPFLQPGSTNAGSMQNNIIEWCHLVAHSLWLDFSLVSYMNAAWLTGMKGTAYLLIRVSECTFSEFRPPSEICFPGREMSYISYYFWFPTKGNHLSRSPPASPGCLNFKLHTILRGYCTKSWQLLK